MLISPFLYWNVTIFKNKHLILEKIAYFFRAQNPLIRFIDEYVIKFYVLIELLFENRFLLSKIDLLKFFNFFDVFQYYLGNCIKVHAWFIF